jgi:hypothetical protein
MLFHSSPGPQHPHHQSQTPVNSSPYFLPSSMQYNSGEAKYAETYDYNRVHHSYAPFSPSPLRNSTRVNIMSSPTRRHGAESENILSSSPLKAAGAFEEMMADAENYNPALGGLHLETPGGRNKLHSLAPVSDGAGSSLTTSLTLTKPLHSQAPESSTNSTSTSQPRESPWSLASRSSSPQARLTTEITRNRNARRSRFADRRRRWRDDDRAEEVGNQLQRLEFIQDRREFEAMMERRAALQGTVAWEDEEDLEQESATHGEDSVMPPDDLEVDFFCEENLDLELIKEYEALEAARTQHGQEFAIDMDSDGIDDEVFALFTEMEMKSPGATAKQRNEDAAMITSNSAEAMQQRAEDPAMDMDLS